MQERIKIVRCSDASLWYNNRIGEEFSVKHKVYNNFTKTYEYWVRTADAWNTSNWIHAQDIETI